MLLVLEGVDGSGKTTVADLLAKRIADSGKTIVKARTPGVLPYVRDLVLNPDYEVSNRARLLFFLGEMMAYVDSTISSDRFPKDTVHLLDRFFLSTYVYQVCCNRHKLPYMEYLTIEHLFTLLPKVDFTVILETTVETAKERSGARNLEFGKKDVFESSLEEEWQRRKSFYDTAETLWIASKLGVIIRIDTTNITSGQVAEQIYNRIWGALI